MSIRVQPKYGSDRTCRIIANRNPFLYVSGVAFILLSQMAPAQGVVSDGQRHTETVGWPYEGESHEYLSESDSTCLFPPDARTPPTVTFTSAERSALGGGTPHRIVVRFIIVRKSDGSGGLDEALLDPFMRDLNYGFRDTPFVFVQSPEIVYHDDDALYTNIPTFQAGMDLLSTYAQPGVVNHVLAPTLIGGPPITGLNSPVNPRGNVLAYHRIGHPHSIAYPPHEMGHVFWLFHPYEPQFGIQCTSEVSCSTRGDLVCDTPASPIVFGGSSGNTTGTGFFHAQIPGPCAGDPLYAPLTDVYMEAGWAAGHILKDRFTPGEVDRMVDTLLAFSLDLISSFRPDVLVDCDGNGVDDVDEILAGAKVDLGRDLVPDVCQTFPEPANLIVSEMSGVFAPFPFVDNRLRYYDGHTGAWRGDLWNGMAFAHQLRLGPDGLVYMATLTMIQRIDLETGRTVDNFIDGILEGASVFVDLLFEPSGDILVLDNVSRNIRRYSGADGTYLGDFADLSAAGMTSPKYMEYGPDGNIYIVGNGAGGNTIQVIDSATGQSLGSFITPGAGGLITGQGLVFHTDGMLYVSNGIGNSILRYDATTGDFDGVFVSGGSGGLSNPHSLRFGTDGNLYVASRNTNSVKRYVGTTGNSLGDFVAPNSGGSVATGGLSSPAGLLFVPGELSFEVDQPAPAPPPFDVRTNRFVSVSPNNPDIHIALKVDLLDHGCSSTGKKCSANADCKACVGGTSPGAACTISSDCDGGGSCDPSGETCVEQSPPIALGWLSPPVVDPGDSPPGTVTAAIQSFMPPLREWSEPVVQISDCQIAPVQTYGISATRNGILFSDPLIIGTIEKPQGKFWADIVGGFDGVEWSEPNNLVNVSDVSSMIAFLTDKPGKPHITRVDLAGASPTYTNFIVNATDLLLVLKGFQGDGYPPVPFVAEGYPADGDVTQCP